MTAGGAPIPIRPTPLPTYRTVSGDFNGDGLDDIALIHRTNTTTARFYVILGAGDHFEQQAIWLALNLDAFEFGWWTIYLSFIVQP